MYSEGNTYRALLFRSLSSPSRALIVQESRGSYLPTNSMYLVTCFAVFPWRCAERISLTLPAFGAGGWSGTGKKG